MSEYVRGHHNWGCGALNNTAPCSCGDGLTVEQLERNRPWSETARLKQETEDRINGIGLSMKESLRRLDLIAEEKRSTSESGSL